MYTDFNKENLDPEEEIETDRKCHQCGEPSEKLFCSKECEREYVVDNETD